MVVYFTGTGNSRYCAQMIADNLDDQLVDSREYIKTNHPADFTSDSPWIFVAPTYAWQLPRVFSEFIRTGRFQGARDAYFVMTCGSEIGGAAGVIAKLCKEVGLTFQGVLQVDMPNNYIAMYKAPSEEETEKIIAAGRPVLERGIQQIRQGKPFPVTGSSLIEKAQSEIGTAVFYRIFVTAKPFYTTEACIRCGKCKNLCPLNNISLDAGKPVWHDQCTHCMACISGCTTQAIEYGRHSVGKRRYWCR